MKKLAITTSLLAALFSIPASADSVRITEIPDSVRITVTAIDCPLDFTDHVSGDFEAITLLFNETMLWSERRGIHCRIGIDYTYPAGWRFRRPSATARGAEVLTDDGQTSVWALRSRLGDGRWRSENAVTEGPVDSRIQIDVPHGGGEPATACGATSAHLEVELFGSLFGPASDAAFSTIDSIDTAIDWERCP